MSPPQVQVQVQSSSSSSTDYMPNPLFASFTKSRNWAQKLVDELSDFICVLNPQSTILFASASCRSMVGFTSAEMVHCHVSEFVHPDDARALTHAIAAAAQRNQPFSVVHRFRRKNAEYCILKIQGRTLASFSAPLAFSAPAATPATSFPFGLGAGVPDAPPPTPMPLVVFVAREYPGKLSPFLDSVLDLRIENERLMTRKREIEASIARSSGAPQVVAAAASRKQPRMAAHETNLPRGERRSEEAEEQGDEPASATSSSAGSARTTTATASTTAEESAASSLAHWTMPQARPMPSIPTVPVGSTPTTMGIWGEVGSSVPVTDQGGASAPNAATATASTADPIRNTSWYDAPAHLPGPPLSAAAIARHPQQLVDMRRSTAAVASFFDPLLGGGNVVEPAPGMDAMTGEDPNKRKRKRRVAALGGDERACIDCGTTSSPEWRKGPTGAKTLCNACGLRYAKKIKTERDQLAAQASSMPQA
ncbi:hypothetical protein BC828DRAFT_378502 [Blastocladiella britannica]|nr:hypothetical protein BC828DRAFT_378502 [Blastocladiella britannica]